MSIDVASWQQLPIEFVAPTCRWFCQPKWAGASVAGHFDATYPWHMTTQPSSGIILYRLQVVSGTSMSCGTKLRNITSYAPCLTMQRHNIIFGDSGNGCSTSMN